MICLSLALKGNDSWRERYALNLVSVPPLRAITIIDAAWIEIIDGMSAT